MSEQRTPLFRRNHQLETLLEELNTDLQPTEQRLMLAHQATACMPYPIVLVMGPLRSGTTLFTQWLANTGLVAYPTNLLSRFYQAPIIGAKIQLLLTDPRFNFRDELGEFIQDTEYRSENGKTKGALAPNEFWYFWRRFLTEPIRDIWTDDELKQCMNTQTMLAELIGMMHVFQKPFAAKGMLFNYNIRFLNEVFDKAIFIHIKREEVTNVMSVLDARERQLGSREHWYSFKIPEYEQLKNQDPITQASGQVRYINNAVSEGLKHVPSHRKLVIQYEHFCENPKKYYNLLADRIGGWPDYSGPGQFEPSRSLDGKLSQSINQALAQLP